MRSLSMFFCALWAAPAFAAVPLGMKLEDGAIADVTDDGLDTFEGVVADFVPDRIDVPAISLSDQSGCNPTLGCLYAYSLDSRDLVAFIDVESVDVEPRPGQLTVTASASARVNSAGVPGTLDYAGELLYVNFSGTCGAWVRPIDVDINAAMDLTLVPDPAGVDVDGDGSPDTKRLDANVSRLTWTWDAEPDDIQLSNCGGIDALVDVLGFFGLNLRQIIIDQVAEQIDALVATLPEQIEPLLEEAFAGLVISQEIDLLGQSFAFTVWPDRLDVDENGVRAALATVVGGEIHPCMRPYGISGSTETPGSPPSMAHPGAPVDPPHAVAMVDDDLLNHLLFGVWATGVLCIDLAAEDSPVELPFALDSSLLGLLAGEEAFSHLFPEPSPLGVVTDPREPPLAEYGGPNDVDIRLDPLGVRFTAEVDGRVARILNVDLSADVGGDVAFEPTTGVFDLLLDAQSENIGIAVTYNEFAPESTGQIESAFGTILSTVVDPLLGDLPAISLPLPAIEGIGVTDLVVEPTGDSADHLGVFTTVGPVPYTSAKGCETSGCTSGCSSSGPTGLLWLVFPITVALVRRRAAP